MVFNSWVELEQKCPIDISRMIRYSNEFNSNVNVNIKKSNLNRAKESLLDARSALDSMINSLIQLLYNKDILKKETDNVLFGWLKDDFGRFMKNLDEKEEHLLIKFDEPTESESRVGISRLSAYAKTLKTTADSLIYESLLKATKDYNEFKETKDLKKEPRTFLYILFQVLQVTLSIMGGITREKTGSFTKRGIVTQLPTNWSTLMGRGGQDNIKEGYKQETGHELQELTDLEDIGEDEEEPEEE